LPRPQASSASHSPDQLILQLLNQLQQIGETAGLLKQSLTGNNENLDRFGSLTGHFWGLDKVSLPGQVEEVKSEGDKP